MPHRIRFGIANSNFIHATIQPDRTVYINFSLFWAPFSRYHLDKSCLRCIFSTWKLYAIHGWDFFSAILSCNLSPRWTAAAVRLILLPISWNNKLDKNVKNVENKWRILHLEWWSINNIVQTLRVWFNSDVNRILYSFQQLNTPRPYSLYTEYLKYKSAQVFSKSIIVTMQFP